MGEVPEEAAARNLYVRRRSTQVERISTIAISRFYFLPVFNFLESSTFSLFISNELLYFLI